MSGYIFEFQGQQFTPEGAVTVPSTAEHNAVLAQQELTAWQTRPDHWAGYVTFPATYPVSVAKPYEQQRVTLTTWMGELLGHGYVTGVFRNNLTGSRTVAIRVRGTNGATYIGRFGDEWSQLCRVRRVKG